MRAAIILSVAVLTFGLSACATSEGAGIPRYRAEMDRLRSECEARGGILMARPGANSGEPAVANQCEIRGGVVTPQRNQR